VVRSSADSGVSAIRPARCRPARCRPPRPVCGAGSGRHLITVSPWGGSSVRYVVRHLTQRGS
jgi:hypothetical protein